MTTEKRSIDKDNLIFNVSVVIVDIEGTTTSINFVKDTLFPYAREHLEEYINSKWTEKELQEDVSLLREQAVKDAADKVDGVVEIPEGEGEEVKTAVIKNVLWQMDNDRKTKSLKQLQGHIWRSGYSSGKIVGHIYDDVKECLTSWKEAGKKLYVYSSGSVEAQKLLFGNSKGGDLLPVFSGYFDTEVGPKTESSSYSKILEHLKENSHLTGGDGKDVLFLTDVSKEAQAATEAGMQAAIVIREGNAPLPDDVKDSFPTISSFSDLSFEGNAKRRKLSHESENVGESKAENVKGGSDLDKDMEMEVCSNDNSAATEPVTNSNDESKRTETADVKSPEEIPKAASETKKQEESEGKAESMDIKSSEEPAKSASDSVDNTPKSESASKSSDSLEKGCEITPAAAVPNEDKETSKKSSDNALEVTESAPDSANANNEEKTEQNADNAQKRTSKTVKTNADDSTKSTSSGNDNEEASKTVPDSSNGENENSSKVPSDAINLDEAGKSTPKSNSDSADSSKVSNSVDVSNSEEETKKPSEGATTNKPEESTENGSMDVSNSEQSNNPSEGAKTNKLEESSDNGSMDVSNSEETKKPSEGAKTNNLEESKKSDSMDVSNSEESASTATEAEKIKSSDDVSSSEERKINGISTSEEKKEIEEKVCLNDAANNTANECVSEESDKKEKNTIIENLATKPLKDDRVNAPDSTVESDVEMKEIDESSKVTTKEENSSQGITDPKKTENKIEESSEAVDAKSMEVCDKEAAAASDDNKKLNEPSTENDIEMTDKEEAKPVSKTKTKNETEEHKKESSETKEKSVEKESPPIENGEHKPESSMEVETNNETEKVPEDKEKVSEEIPKADATNSSEVKAAEESEKNSSTGNDVSINKEATSRSAAESVEKETVANDKEKHVEDKGDESNDSDKKVSAASTDKTENNKADNKESETKTNYETLSNGDANDDNKETDAKKTDNNSTLNGTHETCKNGVSEDEPNNIPGESALKEKVIEKVKENSAEQNGVEAKGEV